MCSPFGLFENGGAPFFRREGVFDAVNVRRLGKDGAAVFKQDSGLYINYERVISKTLHAGVSSWKRFPSTGMAGMV